MIHSVCFLAPNHPQTELNPEINWNETGMELIHCGPSILNSDSICRKNVLAQWISAIEWRLNSVIDWARNWIKYIWRISCWLHSFLALFHWFHWISLPEMKWSSIKEAKKWSPALMKPNIPLRKSIRQFQFNQSALINLQK